MKQYSFKVALALVLILFCLGESGRADSKTTASREAEWKAYKYPAGEFARFLDSTGKLIFRVPVEWQPSGNFQFKGPDSVELSVSVQEIPDGAPLDIQVALERRERLPVDLLMELLATEDVEIMRLASIHLGDTGSSTEIPRISDHAVKSQIRGNAMAAGDDYALGRKQAVLDLSEEMWATIKKIRLRELLEDASAESKKQIIKTALEDADIQGWVWSEYLRAESAAPALPASWNAATPPPVSKFGENIFPREVTSYLALPNPGQALNRIADALGGLRMDTARSQSDLALMLNSMRTSFAGMLDAPPGGALLDYTGINMSEPIVSASWRAEGSPNNAANAERKAVIARVSDRDRFERLLALYQRSIGGFREFPEYASLGARLLGLVPAVLPMIATNSLRLAPTSGLGPQFRFYLVGRDDVLGLPVKVFERHNITGGRAARDQICLAYVNDTAVMAPDRESLADALERLARNTAGLSENDDFKRAIAEGGDAIYMSRMDKLFGSAAGKGGIIETGALSISNRAWESSFKLTPVSGSLPPIFRSFKPRDLTSPRELLPRSTYAYILASVNAEAAWREWASSLLGQERVKQIGQSLTVDFEKEVLAEAGAEAGAALLAAPVHDRNGLQIHWAVFIKLRSEKLARMADEGKLFKELPAQTAPSVAMAIKNGYFIIAGNKATLARFDDKEKLASSRDFIKGLESAPVDALAFGGYSLEAAMAEIKRPAGDWINSRLVEGISSIARAFHGQSFYAAATPSGATARLSVSLGREGRYSVEDVRRIAKDDRPTNFVIEPRGLPVADQRRLEYLKLRVRAKAPGVADSIKADLALEGQTADKISDNELIVTVRPRRFEEATRAQLPITGDEYKPFLEPTREMRSDDQSIVSQARQIAGEDRDSWSVARKLADWTFNNLKWKSVAYATASQTLATREADCLEFSELYVAMARSLGLPARIVSGIAYSDGSFGGHAWVEVYVGRWVELDPTWGTDFADATHIRDSSGEMLNYGALDVLTLEVLEAPRAIPDYQRDAHKLVLKLAEEMSEGKESAAVAALDLAMLVDERLGAGAWNGLTDAEREQVYSAYERILGEITGGFRKGVIAEGVRVLGVTPSGESVEALALNDLRYEEGLVRIKLARRAGLWLLTDIVLDDSGARIISDYLDPAVELIRERRSGKSVPTRRDSAFTRALGLVDSDDAVAIEIIDEALKADPRNARLRYLKAVALDNSGKEEEARALWAELGGEQPAFAPAVWMLAESYMYSEADEEKKGAEQFEIYAKLVPGDPRPYSTLAEFYEEAGDRARAESMHRAAIERDPAGAERRTGLVAFLALGGRAKDAWAAVDEGARHGLAGEDLALRVLTSVL